MVTRKRSICVLLSVIFVWTAGCSTSPPTLETEISDYLKVSESMQKEMSQSIQEINKTSDAEHSTVHVRQTFGNQRELYVLYDVTFAEEIDLMAWESILPQTVTLSGVEESGTLNYDGNVDIVAVEEQTITYLSYFDGRTSQWPEGDLLFTLGQFGNSSQNKQSKNAIIADEIHEITWFPTNHGTILEKDICSEEGEVIGSLTLSPFSLRYQVDYSEQKDVSDFLLTVAIIDKDGKSRSVKGVIGATNNPQTSYSLTNIHGSTEFREILDLSNVVAVQIDGYTVALVI